MDGQFWHTAARNNISFMHRVFSVTDRENAEGQRPLWFVLNNLSIKLEEKIDDKDCSEKLHFLLPLMLRWRQLIGYNLLRPKKFYSIELVGMRIFRKDLVFMKTLKVLIVKAVCVRFYFKFNFFNFEKLKKKLFLIIFYRTENKHLGLLHKL